jgi:hypothetical protein
VIEIRHAVRAFVDDLVVLEHRDGAARRGGRVVLLEHGVNARRRRRGLQPWRKHQRGKQYVENHGDILRPIVARLTSGRDSKKLCIDKLCLVKMACRPERS